MEISVPFIGARERNTSVCNLLQRKEKKLLTHVHGLHGGAGGCVLDVRLYDCGIFSGWLSSAPSGASDRRKPGGLMEMTRERERGYLRMTQL